MTSLNTTTIGRKSEQSGTSEDRIYSHNGDVKYRPLAEYETIRREKKNTSIPLISYGDICDEETAAFVLGYEGADGVLIGRNSFGRPRIYAELNKQLFGIQHASEITDEYKRIVAVKHVEAVQKLYTNQQIIRTLLPVIVLTLSVK